MKFLISLLSTLVAIACLLGSGAAGVIPATDLDPQQKPAGWCCSDDCDVCNPGNVHCHDGDHLTCWDLTWFNEIITHTCCFLDRKLDAAGNEKFYTPRTGNEVKFLAPKLQSRAETTGKEVGIVPPVAALEHRMPPPDHPHVPPMGWCCLGGCRVCDTRCTWPSYRCLDSPIFTTCCMEERKIVDGVEKYYTPSGEEVQFMSEAEALALVLTGRGELEPAADAVVERQPAVGEQPAMGACCDSKCAVCEFRFCREPTLSCSQGVLFDDSQTCCMLESKIGADGGEKYYALTTGAEVQFIGSPNSKPQDERGVDLS